MKKHSEYDAVVAGHVCLDITPRFLDGDAKDLSKIIRPGRLINVANASISTGGAVSNTGLCLLRLGLKTALMGKTGNDFFGTGIRAIFKERGAEKALNISEGEETSYSIVLAPPGIDRIFFHHPGANDTFRADDINYDIVSKARLFHFGYPTLMKALYSDNGAELIEIFKRVKKLGLTTSLDMTLPDTHSESGRIDWAGILSDLLPLVDIAPFSAEEALFMLNRPRFEEISRLAGSGDSTDLVTESDLRWVGRELIAKGANMAAVKCGCRGIMLVTAGEEKIAGMGAAAPENAGAWAERELWAEAFEVDVVVSATGAGDSAIAGFISGLLKGYGPEQSLAAACCLGAQNVQVVDAVSGIRSWDETVAMSPRCKRRRLQPGPDWRYDSTHGVWNRPRPKA